MLLEIDLDTAITKMQPRNSITDHDTVAEGLKAAF